MSKRVIISERLVMLVVIFILTSFSLFAAPIDQLEGRVGRTIKGFRALKDGKAAYQVEPKRQLSKLKGALKTIKAYDKLIEDKNKERAEKLKVKVKEEIKVVTAYIEKKDMNAQKKKQNFFDKKRSQKQLEELINFENKFEIMLKRVKKFSKKHPKGQYESLDDLFQKVNKLEMMESNKERHNQLKEKISKEMKRLNNYMSSKEYKKIKNKMNQEYIDSWRLGKTKMKAGKYFGIIKKELPKGKILRVVIESPVWQIKRELKVIKYKFLDVNVGLKYKKKCYLLTGELKRIYQGGGRYGKVYFNTFKNKGIEMNCKNVYK